MQRDWLTTAFMVLVLILLAVIGFSAAKLSIYAACEADAAAFNAHPERIDRFKVVAWRISGWDKCEYLVTYRGEADRWYRQFWMDNMLHNYDGQIEER